MIPADVLARIDELRVAWFLARQRRHAAFSAYVAAQTDESNAWLALDNAREAALRETDATKGATGT